MPWLYDPYSTAGMVMLNDEPDAVVGQSPDMPWAKAMRDRGIITRDGYPVRLVPRTTPIDAVVTGQATTQAGRSNILPLLVIGTIAFFVLRGK